MVNENNQEKPFEEIWKVRIRRKPKWFPLWLYNFILDRVIYSEVVESFLKD